jgi:hypothetical protein
VVVAVVVVVVAAVVVVVVAVVVGVAAVVVGVAAVVVELVVDCEVVDWEVVSATTGWAVGYTRNVWLPMTTTCRPPAAVTGFVLGVVVVVVVVVGGLGAESPDRQQTPKVCWPFSPK